jgi:hypothetical protein
VREHRRGSGEAEAHPSAESRLPTRSAAADARAGEGVAWHGDRWEKGGRDPVFLGCGKGESHWAVGPSALAGPFEPSGLSG